MEKKKLTKAQSNVLDFIEAYMEKKKMPPTYDEIADNFGFKSKNSVESHLQALERKGVIKKIAGKARGITLSESAYKKNLIPLVGTVAAGMPVLAEENIIEYLDLYKVFYTDVEIFALNVKGESMIKAGIMDGDIVVVRKQPVLRDGEIGVVIIENEATVKRVYFKGDKIILRPENDRMKDIIVFPEEKQCFIAGKVIGVIRKDVQ
ncbi:MAG: transcriptional repressor LexA [bacterium]|nr:transcriptional repressor LexA [bacterium]